MKVHPRKAPGQRSTDPADLPTGTEIYATRDIDRLRRMAADHGEAIGIYATALLDTPLPWTKMRQVYRLLGLVKKWGPTRVEQACQRALDAEAVDVNLVSRMLERGPKAPNPTLAPTRSSSKAASPATPPSSPAPRRRADERPHPAASTPN